MYSYEIRAGYSAVDETFQMKVTSMLDCFQDAAIFEAENGGKINTQYLDEKGLVWLLSAWQIVIDRRPKLNERIKIKTFPYDFKGFLGYRNFMITDAQDEVIVKAASIWTLLDTVKGLPAKPTQELLDGYDLAPKLAMEYAPRKIAVLGEGVQQAPFPVRRWQIDSNRHVNNVAYVRMALEFVETQERIRELRVEYKRAAHYGDMIVPVVYQSDKKTQVQLKDETGGLFALVECSVKS